MRTNKLHVIRYLSVASVLLLLVMFVTGCSEKAAPTAALIDSSIENPTGALSKTVVARVSMGGADICEGLGLPPGCDANQSLIAIKSADGSVRGEWHDQFSNGFGVHVDVTCLTIVGKDAWVSGTIKATRIPGFVGLHAIIRVRDNGVSANDPADQASFTNLTTNANDCLQTPVTPAFVLFNITGQVSIK